MIKLQKNPTKTRFWTSFDNVVYSETALCWAVTWRQPLHAVTCCFSRPSMCPGVEPTRYPTSELIRRKNAGEPLEDDEDKDALPRGRGNWLGGYLQNLRIDSSNIQTWSF